TEALGAEVQNGQTLCAVLIVLLSNAIDACTPMPDIAADERPIRVGVWRDEATREVVVEVVDQGPGIGDRAAGAYERGDESLPSTKPGHGAGRGLVVARDLAAGLGWRLVIASRRGPTAFQLRVPT